MILLTLATGNALRAAVTTSRRLTISTGCAGMSQQDKGTAVGAGVGAVGGAVLTGGSVLTDANGRATFSALEISGPATSYTLSFTSVPLTGLVSPPVAIAAGTAVKLAFITAPSITATNGTDLFNLTGNVRFDGETPTVGDHGILTQNLPIVFVASGADTTAITVVITNGDTVI